MSSGFWNGFVCLFTNATVLSDSPAGQRFTDRSTLKFSSPKQEIPACSGPGFSLSGGGSRGGFSLPLKKTIANGFRAECAIMHT